MKAPRIAPVPPVPKKTQRIIRAGVVFALLCAAAMSAPTLFNLAELVGFKRNLAWLLPACLDGYAGTSILFGSKVPASHPARSAATKNARLALALTVFANGGYHLLTLAGTMIPPWLPTALLVTVSSLPPFIVHRLLHLHSLADGSDAETPTAVTQAPADRRPTPAPMKPRTADRPPMPVVTATTAIVGATDGEDADVVEFGTAAATARLNADGWAVKVLPLYRGYRRTHGEAPKAPQLAALMTQAGHGTFSPSRARDIRRATDDLDKKTPEPDRELIGAVR